MEHRFNPDKYYCIDGTSMNYLERLKDRLGEMRKINADEMRDVMNRLFLILNDAEED